MSNIAIKAEDISKLYRLGEFGTGSLGQDFNRWWHKIRGKEDPFFKVGTTNERSKKAVGDFVWALRNIDFEIRQGDAVGIIGRNGAGKSTLLKILSRTTSPTTGSIKIKGRIANLLEVGTGFHPELSGKDNIFLNGAILGMTKKEIGRRFDEIVEFSGVERYIDTPVKRYSSGMYVRLAFAVAAHLESEIIILDEVLAVGDAEFQKKCLGKLDNINSGQGRTVLFVSHNIGAVRMLCQKGIFLENGQMVMADDIDPVINAYLRGKFANNQYICEEVPSKEAYFKSIACVDAFNNVMSEFKFNESVTVNLHVKIREPQSGIIVSVALLDNFTNKIFTVLQDLDSMYGDVVDRSEIILKVELPSHLIAPGHYSFHCRIFKANGALYDWQEEICNIEVLDSGTKFSMFNDTRYGYLHIDGKWSLAKPVNT
jgi:lipopolysaccharide transport system ATP-binding protein